MTGTADSSTPREQQAALSVPTVDAIDVILKQAEHHSKLDPARPAILQDSISLSYRELNDRSNQVARFLQGLGVQSGEIVGVCRDRGPDLFVLWLGIWKCGAAFVMLDPTHPPVRLSAIVADAKPRWLLVDSAKNLRFEPHASQILYWNSCREAVANLSAHAVTGFPTSDGSAYVIYTSGSTGDPKGVLVGHLGLAQMASEQLRVFQASGNSRILQFASLSFDASIFEMTWAFGAGATLILPGRGASPVGRDLLHLLRSQRITHTVLPPSVLSTLPVLPLPDLECLVVAGETCPQTLVDDWAPGRRFFNAYGPTESTIWASYAECFPGANRPSIGHPIRGTEILLLDESLRPVADGETGEICLTGVGLAKGYLNNPALTAQQFCAHPVASRPGERLFRSRDLGRRLPGGAIEFLGRLDRQVKVRGFRIELEEIEVHLGKHPRVLMAVAGVRGKSLADRYVAAWVTVRQLPDSSADARDLHAIELDIRQFLVQRLPAYMVPSVITITDRFPTLPNGKVDRARLTLEPAEGSSLDSAAKSSIQMDRICRIFAEILDRPAVFENDNLFSLGLHSLHAAQALSTIKKQFGVDLSLTLLMDAPTPGSLLREIERFLSNNPNTATNFRSTDWRWIPDTKERNNPFPLTDVQKAYLMGRGADYELGNVGTHVFFEIDSTGIARDQLGRSFNHLIIRHEMLRAVVHLDGTQRILPSVPPYTVDVLDFSSLQPDEAEAALSTIREEMSHSSLPANVWPLFDVRWVDLPSAQSRLLINLDLLICDAASVLLLFREWRQIYENPYQILPQLKSSYRDYVVELSRRSVREDFSKSRDYWLARLDRLPSAPMLPNLASAVRAATPRFERRNLEIDRRRWEILKRMGTDSSLTASIVLASAFAAVLKRWSRFPNFTFNVPLFQRPDSEPTLEGVIGDFTSLTLLEVVSQENVSFRDFARALQKQFWRDLEHQDYEGTKLLHEIARQSGQPHRAPMPVVFTSALPLDCPTGNEPLFGQFGPLIRGLTESSQVALDHIAFEDQGMLRICWDSRQGWFPAGVLDSMFEAYHDFLRSLADDYSAWSEPIPSFLPISQSLARPILENVPRSDTLVFLDELFAQWVVSNPDSPAVCAGNRVLTRIELGSFSDTLAGHLVKSGARRNQLVAIVMEKGWEQVVAVFAVLKSGAAYLPVDPVLPPARIHELLRLGDVSLALTTPAVDVALSWPEFIRHIPVEQTLITDTSTLPVGLDRRGDDLAYVIFTSGSTGTPKGVMIDHCAAVNTVLDVNRRFGFNQNTRTFGLSSLSFDLSVWDIFGTLAAGGMLVLPDPIHERDPAAWVENLCSHKVNTWNSVPALMRLLMEHLTGSPGTKKPNLEIAMLSGDWIPLTLPKLMRQRWPKIKIISLGGATEASIWSNFHVVEELDSDWPSIPYGRPLSGQLLTVFDSQLEHRPDWVVGEIFIAGTGLARGYWKEPARTAERFVFHPKTGVRWYRTGDLGRFRPGGIIEFLGREDGQVKVGGYRIELGEIESRLKAHPKVLDAVAGLVNGLDERERLVAWVVPRFKNFPGDQETPAGISTPGALSKKLELIDSATTQGSPGNRIPLASAGDDPIRAVLGRRTIRTFDPRPVPLNSLANLLETLRRIDVDSHPFPKARYPSAGSLYPVKVFVLVREGCVPGLDSCCYEYDPHRHQLGLALQSCILPSESLDVANRRIWHQAAFALFLVADLEAVQPVYGSLSRDFSIFEAGCITQLLMSESHNFNLGLCPIGHLDSAPLETALRLGPNRILVHTVFGGNLPTHSLTPHWLPLVGEGLEGELRSYLETWIPGYMVPQKIQILDALPLTQNGKLDRTSLKAMMGGYRQTETQSAGDLSLDAADDTALLVRTLFSEITGNKNPEDHLNFFAAGADSLQLVRLQNQLQQKLGVRVAMVDLFRHPSIAKLARFLEQQRAVRTHSEVSPETRAREQRSAIRRLNRLRNHDQ